MNKTVSFSISFIVALLTAIAIKKAKGWDFDFDGTSFVVYWAFIYYVFHDKKKDE